MGRFGVILAMGLVLVACLDHTNAALQEVRFVVEEVTAGRPFEGRLMGYNTLPETLFEDIKTVLRLAKERVAVRLKQAQR